MHAIAQRLALVALGLAVSFGLLEIGTRLFADRPFSVKVERPESTVPSGAEVYVENDSARVMMVRTPTGMRLARNSRAVIEKHPTSGFDTVVETNSQGFRHRELPLKQPEDYRVLMLGDSITLSAYLDAELSIPSVIQRGLMARRQPRDANRQFEVINAGIGGIDLQNELAILLESGFEVEPDLVLVGSYLNDANESVYLDVSRLPDAVSASRFLAWLFDRFHLLRARFAVDALREDQPDLIRIERARFRARNEISQADWRVDTTGFNRRIDLVFHDWGFAWSDPYWEKSRELYRVIREVTEDRDVELAVVLFPVALQIESEVLRDEPQQQFRRVMNELGIRHYDPLPMLRQRYQNDGIDLLFDYCHYDAAGSQVVGDAIAAFLHDEVIAR